MHILILRRKKKEEISDFISFSMASLSLTTGLLSDSTLKLENAPIPWSSVSLLVTMGSVQQ